MKRLVLFLLLPALASASVAAASSASGAERAARLAAWSEGLRTNANPRTQARFRDEVFLPFWRRQTVEPFLAGPEGKEPWAPEAVRLMEREIFELWNTALVPPCIDPPGVGEARDRSDLVEFAERVRTKDPFLLFLRLLAFWERFVRAQPDLLSWSDSRPSVAREERGAFRRAVAETPGAELERFLVAGARFHGRNVHVGAVGLEDASRRAVEWLAACRPSPEESRAARWLLSEIFPSESLIHRTGETGAAAVLADALEAAGDAVDPWLARVARGQAELEKAEWGRLRSRGDGGASALAAARKNLEEAWGMRRDPVSAGLMVLVAARTGADDAETWFARATDAEIDFDFAYEAYASAVCRDSADRLRAFADACRDAGHDGSAPGFWWVMSEIRLARLEGRDPRELFADAAFADRCGRIAGTVRDDPGRPRRIRRAAARLAAAIPLLHGDFARAAAQQRFRTPDAEIALDDPDFVRVPDMETVLAGIAGPHSGALVRIEELRRAGDSAAVRREAEALLDPAAGLAPDETALAAWRADDARAALEWDSGAWIPLRFSVNGVFANGWTGTGWFGTSRPRLSDDRWTAGDGWCASVARPGRYVNVLRCAVSVPDTFELRGTAEWDRTAERDCHPCLGFNLDPEDAPFFQDRLDEVHVDPDPKWGGTMLGLNGAWWGRRPDESARGKYVFRDFPGKFDFRIVWGADSLSVWIGDDPTPFVAPRKFRSSGGGARRDRRLTIDGRAVRLTRLEMRNPGGPAPADGARPPEPALPPIDRPPARDFSADPCGILANARTNAAMRTRAAFVRDSLAPLLRRELLDPFEAGPEASAPWADEARAFLEDSVRLAGYDTLSRRFDGEWEPAVRLVLERGAAAPALRWGCAMGLAAAGRRDEAREQVRALREAVAGADGTPFLRYLAALADWRVDGRARDETARLGVAWAETLADRPQDSRAVLHVLRQDNGTAQLAPLLEASRADPWLGAATRCMEESFAAANAAWRQSGTPEDAFEYGRRFAAARAALERACALHPEFPEPAREFLETWRDRLDREEFGRLLRRALAAGTDDAGLVRLCESLVAPPGEARNSPAAGRARREFGRRLADCGRADSQLPALGVAILADAAAGAPAGERLWEDDGDAGRLRAVGDSLRGNDAVGWLERDRAQAFDALCARLRGEPDVRIDASRRMRHALHPGDPLFGWPNYLLPYINLHRDRCGDAARWIESMAGENAVSFVELERLVRAGDPEEVLRFADALAASPPRPFDRDEAWGLLEARTDAWLATRFFSGEALPAPVSFRGFRFLSGPKTGHPAPDAVLFPPGLDASADADRCFVAWDPGFPRDLRLEGWIEAPTNAPPGATNAIAVFRTGPGTWTPGDLVSARVFLRDGRAGAAAAESDDVPDADVRWIDAPGPRVPFRVEWLGGWLRIWLGDGPSPLVETDSFRTWHGRLAGTPAGILIRGGSVVVGGLAVRAPLGAAAGEEQPDGVLPRFKTVLLPGGVPLELAWCPAGTFEEGFWELERHGWTGGNPAPRRTAELTRGFWLARCETTRAQWRAVTGADAPGEGAPDEPAAVGWDAAAAFAEKLAALAPEEGRRWTLPAETQWERAARAGREGPLDPVALGEARAPKDGARPGPAGTCRDNPWGFRDLCGNAWEWCADDYAPRDSIDPVRDPPPVSLGPGAPKAVRGGAADSAHPAELTPGFRAGRVRELRIPSIGFRVILEEDPSLSTNAQ